MTCAGWQGRARGTTLYCEASLAFYFKSEGQTLKKVHACWLCGHLRFLLAAGLQCHSTEYYSTQICVSLKSASAIAICPLEGTVS